MLFILFYYGMQILSDVPGFFYQRSLKASTGGIVYTTGVAASK
jgi:hypothetical protein